MTETETASRASSQTDASKYILTFDKIGNADIPSVGGKNASLGEMISALAASGINVPSGFALTTETYRDFLRSNQLEGLINGQMARLNRSELGLAEVGQTIRHAILEGEWPEEIRAAIVESYRDLAFETETNGPDVAVRSSPTAEDLPDASFAGQQESFLHVQGESNLLHTCKRCFASLFTDRAISYREQKGFRHESVALSVGVQRMVRSDLGASGIIFTIDTETGCPDVIVISAAYGLGDNVVQGAVTPDEYRVFKPLLSDGSKAPIIGKSLGSKELRLVYDQAWGGRVRNARTPFTDQFRFALDDDQILKLARWAVEIESHYDRPMDIEWALDGNTDELYIVQARPETVHSRKRRKILASARLVLEEGEAPEVLLEGQAVGRGIVSGRAVVMRNVWDSKKFNRGDIIVAKETNPDWVPLMKIAGGLVTDAGGRTSHAAIVCRELGIPAVIGTGKATESFFYGQEITLVCEGGRGLVYRGAIPHEETSVDLETLPESPIPLMLNLANPDAAMEWWELPTSGVGLVRMEFIITNILKVHPMAVATLDTNRRTEFAVQVEKMAPQFESPREFFVQSLAMGIGMIAASAYPDPAIVRFSDLKTNEYANLVGGRGFEPVEQNPMLGFRGASRYYHEDYRPGFELECEAIKRVRGKMGFRNVIVMIPFCRTVEEADRVLEVMAECGLERGKDDLHVYMMAEIPSNIVLADQFADRFDGFSIGSNDLTQLVLGIDRDSEKLQPLFDEGNEAVKTMISQLISIAHGAGKKVGICGQAPSDCPDFARFLVDQGIDSISLNPDSVIDISRKLAEPRRGA
ncbi:MAG: phosphoenolpyruvate synthase [Verrucomicrobiales bacterium]